MDDTFMVKLFGKIKKKGEPVFAEKERDQNPLITDHLSVAWKQKLKIKLTANIIRYIPKKISRAVPHTP